MKITDAYGKFPQVASKSEVATGGAASTAKGAAVKGKAHAHPAHGAHADSAHVNVSDAAKALAAKSAGDSEKVESLKSSIANGTFKIDASKIASKLVGGDETEE